MTAGASFPAQQIGCVCPLSPVLIASNLELPLLLFFFPVTLELPERTTPIAPKGSSPGHSLEYLAAI